MHKQVFVLLAQYVLRLEQHVLLELRAQLEQREQHVHEQMERSW